jgi:hypothetical protein
VGVRFAPRYARLVAHTPRSLSLIRYAAGFNELEYLECMTLRRNRTSRMSPLHLGASLAVSAALAACATRVEHTSALVPTSACPILVAALAAATDTTAVLAVVAEEVDSRFSEPAPSSFRELKRDIAYALDVEPKIVAQFLDPGRKPAPRATMPICSGPSRTEWQTHPPRMLGNTLMVAMSRPHMMSDNSAVVFVEVTQYYRTAVVTLSDGPAGEGRLYRIELRNGQWMVTRKAPVRAQLRQ